jgi:hypothetical protein
MPGGTFDPESVNEAGLRPRTASVIRLEMADFSVR